MELKGKRAVITGGSRGIGAATAIALAKKGANVAVVYHSHKDKALKIAEKAQSYGVKSLSVGADLRKWPEVQRLMSEIKQALGGIDILINSAGINGENSLIDDINMDE